MNDNFQEKLLENVMDDGKKDYEKITKVLSLNTELKEKD